MRKLRTVAAAAVLSTAALLMTSADVAAQGAEPVDLSTDAAVAAYLRSVGVDPGGVVVQRGLKNYAGPFCPGAGWNCTTATQVVQVAPAGGTNTFECGDPALLRPAVPANPAYAATRACLAVQDAPSGTNTIEVRQQRTNQNNQTLSCVPGTMQQTVGGQNHFNCHLVIQVKGDQLVQSGNEVAAIKQLAVGGGNHANIHLQISLTSAVRSPAGDQRQDAHQSADVDQDATMGAFNHASVHEAQFLRATSRGATTTNQYQNTGGLPQGFQDCVSGSIVTEPNSCAVINQQSDGGTQTSQLKLLNDLDARTDATAGSQNQGAPSAGAPNNNTGLDGTVPQPTTGGTDHSHEEYEERQTTAAGGAGVVVNQTAPSSCCALQTGSSASSTVNANQKSVQRAVLIGPVPPSVDLATLDLTLAMPTPSAVQATLLFGKIATNGDGTLTHDARQDGGSQRQECTAEPVEEGTPACTLVTALVNGQPITCEPGEVLVFTEEGFECQPVLT
jgi:hypothetical protein